MGTKVQCKSLPPDYYPMRGLNGDSSSTRSRYCEDKTSNGYLYNGFMVKPANGYLEYDKEMLKMTMLEHEAIFRKQVYELHRLYRTQKDLMDELKIKNLHKSSVQMDTSHCLFSSLVPSEPTEKVQQMPHVTAVHTSDNRAYVAGSVDLKRPFDFLKEKPNKNGVPLKDGEFWASNLTGHPRRTFDLQLPAEVYIDSEDSERTEIENVDKSPSWATNSFGIIGGVERENDVKLTLGTSKGSCCIEGGRKLDLHGQNGRMIHKLADLNEPMKGLSCEREAASVSTHYIGMRTHDEEILGHQLPAKSNKSFLPRDFFTNEHRDEGTCSNFLNADKGKAEWPSFTNGKSEYELNSFNTSLCSEKFPKFSEPTQLKLKKAHEILSPNYNKRQTWLGEKPINGIETSRSSQFADTNHSGLTIPHVPNPFSVVSCSNFSNTTSPLVSSWRKPTHRITHVPIAVQALPCFKGSAIFNSPSRKSKANIQNPASSCDKSQFNGDLSRPRYGIESSYSSSFHNDIRSETNSSTQLRSNSNSSAYGNSEGNEPQKCSMSLNQALPNGTRNGITAQRDTEGKHEIISGGVTWLEVKPEIKKKQQDFPSSLQFEESRMWRNEDPFSLSSKKTLGFPIIDKSQRGAICSPYSGDVNSNGKNVTPNVGSCSLGYQSHFNLNSAEGSPQSGTEFSSSFSMPSIAKNIASKIDLEAPTHYHVETTGKNHIMMTKTPSEKAHDRQENELPHETFNRLAAENLVALSLDICCPSALASCDSLNWFAEVVSSKAACAEISSDDDDGLDLFESMTLKLEEVKPDEYCCRPQEQENLKQDDNNDHCTASLLFTRPRRGQARKRRQRRDFQKDILPGLASLSRHEVTEDLLAFGGIMRASGKAWQAGLAKRSTGRKRSNCQARVRRPRSLVIAVAEVHAEPMPTQTTTCSELEISGRSIMGWGRTTRRCQRQRVISGNASAALT